ncbi:EAL domain-containing protein [Streptomyces sp. N2-109]|uniref:EAL domain-containing protein n=1 Tax=Streptomyces gossypii TaxID=2883101 RepID=A0ABT2JXI8_9ACTN|nr:EAL domain-containing protein [Streptomyces gossypii]MCT2592607.1 EAL domain-containing protein [Streptomyces gossypii]
MSAQGAPAHPHSTPPEAPQPPPASAERSTRRPWYSAVTSGAVPRIVLAAVCGAYATGAAVGWGSETVALVMGDFGLSAAALLAAASCLWYARAHRGNRLRPAWFLFGLSSAMVGLGNAVWGWYELVLDQPVPRTSVADYCFLLFAPPAIIGLLVFARRPVTRSGWVCLGLDAWLIGGSLLTLSWSLALVHIAAWEDATVARAALTLAYPLLDIVLVSMVLALHFRRPKAARSAVNTAVAALALTVLCDTMFVFPALREGYRSGQLLDAGWFAGSLLLAYAPWVGTSGPSGTSRRCGRHSARQDRAVPGANFGTPVPGPAPAPGLASGTSGAGAAAPAPAPDTAHASAQAETPPPGGRGPMAGSLAALTPYLAAAVCTLSIIYNSINGREIDRVVLFTGCTVVLALVVRQGIMLVDNISLTQELAQKENHFRSLVQGSSDVIMIAAASGVLRYVSPAAAGVYGRDGDALIGTELAALIHREDLSRVLHEVRRFLATPASAEPSTRIECRFRHGAGHWLNVESTVNRYQGGLIFNSRDVTERVRLQAQLQHNASHDPMTDLPNRALFTERVRQALSGRRGGDGDTAVLFIDLDGFKAVNDTVGHQAGDELLINAARRLQESVRAGDTAARLGGDEFAALILGDGNPSTRASGARETRIREIADRLRLTLSEPYRVEGTEVRVAASIGIAFAEPGISPAGLMRNADLAMYRAKQAGKAQVKLYAPQMQADVTRRAEQATKLRSALHRGEFTLLHQPVIELASGLVTAVTAQPRWRSSQGILFTPAEFLRPDGARGAEPQGDRASEMSSWLLEEAVAQAAARHRAGFETPVTVRLSAGRLTNRALGLGTVETLLERHGLPPGSLILELSDSDPRIPLDELEQRLTGLRRLGVGIALDGFGSGYAAMAALRRLPLDLLRLDRGLVDGIAESVRLRKITSGLLRIAGDLGLSSVADGVDLPEQVSVLRSMGCTHGQGAAFSGALDEHRLRRALTSGGYPVPEAVPSAAEHSGAGRSVVVAGSLPAWHTGSPLGGPGPAGGPGPDQGVHASPASPDALK